MPGRLDYEERRQARIERLQQQSARASEQSEAIYRKSNELVENVPMGQPNIIGRPALPRLREKSIGLMGKAAEQAKVADEYAARAKSAEANTTISADDPLAVEKLTAKIEAMEQEQALMKAVNRYYHKHKTCVGCEGLDDERARRLDESMKQAYSWEKAPFPSFTLSNLNQRIKAAKDRIVKLESVTRMPDERISFIGGVIESDSSTNRIIIRFDDVPPDSITDRLKHNGFHWAPTIDAWQRMRSPYALLLAKRMLDVDRKEGEQNDPYGD